MTKTEHPAYFEQQHERLDAQLHAHLLDVVGGDFAGALQRLQQWRRDLDRHTEIENARLLPHVPEGARWAARRNGEDPARRFKLAALRWPERTLVFDDGVQLAAEGFGAPGKAQAAARPS